MQLDKGTEYGEVKPMRVIILVDMLYSPFFYLPLLASFLGILLRMFQFPRASLWLVLLIIASSAIIIGVRFALGLLAYKRTRYQFTSEGLTVEGGINFYSDFIGWRHVQEVRLYRAIPQQLMGGQCGTVEVTNSKGEVFHLSYVANSVSIYEYFRTIIANNLTTSRMITPL